MHSLSWFLISDCVFQETSADHKLYKEENHSSDNLGLPPAHLLVVEPWANCLTCLRLGFFSKMGGRCLLAN